MKMKKAREKTIFTAAIQLLKWQLFRGSENWRCQSSLADSRGGCLPLASPCIISSMRRVGREPQRAEAQIHRVAQRHHAAHHRPCHPFMLLRRTLQRFAVVTISPDGLRRQCPRRAASASSRPRARPVRRRESPRRSQEPAEAALPPKNADNFAANTHSALDVPSRGKESNTRVSQQCWHDEPRPVDSASFENVVLR